MTYDPPWGRSLCLRRMSRHFHAGGAGGRPRAGGLRAPEPGGGGRHASEPPWHLSPGTFQIKQECLTCREAAAVFDMSYFGKFYLVGLDARKAADWLFSADVSRPPGMRPGLGPAPPALSAKQNCMAWPRVPRQGGELPCPLWAPPATALPLGLALGPCVRTPLPSPPSQAQGLHDLPPPSTLLSPSLSSLRLCSRKHSGHQALSKRPPGLGSLPPHLTRTFSPNSVSRIKKRSGCSVKFEYQIKNGYFF